MACSSEVAGATCSLEVATANLASLEPNVCFLRSFELSSWGKLKRPGDLVMQCVQYVQSCSDVDQLRPLTPMQLTCWGDAATCYLQVTPLLTGAAAAASAV